MDHRQALAKGTLLNEFEILSVLGSGGFGIVYLAKDLELNQEVVIKEYLPNEFAIREIDQTVMPKSSKDDSEFEWGLERFLDEARSLAEFRNHPNVVSVLRYFKDNNTAYMVMENAGTQSLKEYLEKKEVLSEEQIHALLWPLLDALKQVHYKGIIHRDLKPANILINDVGDPVLIDFGAARHAIGAKSLSITAIVSAGYSPFEQYTSTGKQGAWTDIYALAGVFYRCITGNKPIDATDRIAGAHQVSATEFCKDNSLYSIALLKSVDWGLELRAEDRPNTIDEWEEALDGCITDSEGDEKIEKKGRTKQPSNLKAQYIHDSTRKVGFREPKNDTNKTLKKSALSILLTLSLVFFGYYLYVKGIIFSENSIVKKSDLQEDLGGIRNLDSNKVEKEESTKFSSIELKKEERIVIPDKIEKRTSIEIQLRATTKVISEIKGSKNKLLMAREQLKGAQDLIKITESKSREKLYREDELQAKNRIGKYIEGIDTSVENYIQSIKELCSFDKDSVVDTMVEMKHKDENLSDYMDIIKSHRKSYCSGKVISQEKIKEKLLLNFN